MQARNATVRETVDARKARFGAQDLGALLRGGRTLVIARGKQSVVIELARARPEELARALGPSGNLRAPAVRVASDWLVGFEADLWTRWFDSRT